MSTEPTIGGTVQSGDFTVTSSHETPEQMTVEYGADGKAEPTDEGGEPDLSKAASDLGKKGGEAAAAKRVAEAKEAAKTERAAKAEEDAGPDERTDEEKKLGKPRHDARARVEQATRREAEAKREAETARRERDEARAEAAKHRAELEAARAGKQPEERPQARQAAAEEPKEEDFDKYSEYTRAVARHEARTAFQEEQRELAAQREEHARQEKVRGTLGGWREAMLKAAESNPTLAEDTAWLLQECRPSFTMPREDPRQRDPRTWIANEMVNNPESAPTLALHFSEHRDDYQRIASLQTPGHVIREMARLAAKLEAPVAEVEDRPSVSRARPPVRSVSGVPPVAGEPDPDSTSFDDHLAWYNKQGRRK